MAGGPAAHLCGHVGGLTEPIPLPVSSHMGHHPRTDAKKSRTEESRVVHVSVPDLQSELWQYFIYLGQSSSFGRIDGEALNHVGIIYDLQREDHEGG